MQYLILDLAVAYFLDLLFGDPYWLPHPVRFIGLLIKKLEKELRKVTGGKESAAKASAEKRAGLVLLVLVVMITTGTVWGLLEMARAVSPILFHLINIYFLYTALAARCLGNEAMKVYRTLRKGDMKKSREQLAMLVGRETDGLNAGQVVRGGVETTAENTVDGIMSPMLYAAAGTLLNLGAPLAYAFKAISTLDSMVGYMNPRYLYFGRASAKMDDAANYLPARLSGVLIPLASRLCGCSFIRSFRIMLRDRRKHKSPNCAYPEAAVAGALGVRLGGTNVYFGQLVEKPTIGDALRELEPEDIRKTVQIMYMASFLTLLLAVGALAAVLG